MHEIPRDKAAAYLAILADLKAKIPRNLIAAKHGLTRTKLAGKIAWLKKWRAFREMRPKGSARPKFANSGSPEKEKARKLVFDAIRRSGRDSGAVLTLPGAHPVMEQKLHETLSRRFHFYAAEKNRVAYERLIKNSVKLGLAGNMTFHLGDIEELSRTLHPNTAAHAILDFCGTLAGCQYAIDRVLSENLVAPGGIVAITLNKRLGCTKRGSKFYMLSLAARSVEERYPDECFMTRAIVGYLVQNHGRNYEFQTIYGYSHKLRDGRQLGARMLLVILRRKPRLIV